MSNDPLSYRDAKALLIERLRRDAWAHDSQEYASIGQGFDELDSGIPRNAGPEFDPLLTGLSFWDGWIDARNHEWQYYDPIKQGDWPRLARAILECLEANQDIEDKVVLDRFRVK